MTRPIPMRVPLQSPIKQLRVENAWDGNDNVWRLWLTGNSDFTLGTFLELGYNGTVRRITWHPDGTESVFEITGE